MSQNPLYYQSEDGIWVGYVQEEHLRQLKEVFVDVWTRDNTLYSTMGVTKQEVGEYVDLFLFERLKHQPKSAGIAVDTRAKNERGEPKIIAFFFNQDLDDDTVPPERIRQLSPSLQLISEFNKDMIAPLYTNPLTKHLTTGKQLKFNLHGGAIPSYRRGRRGGGGHGEGSQLGVEGKDYTEKEQHPLFRVIMMMMMDVAMDGYKGFLGVATHPTTANNSLTSFSPKSPVHRMIFGVERYAIWKPSSIIPPNADTTKPDAHYFTPQDPPPFASIVNPPWAIASLTLYKQRQPSAAL